MSRDLWVLSHWEKNSIELIEFLPKACISLIQINMLLVYIRFIGIFFWINNIHAFGRNAIDSIFSSHCGNEYWNFGFFNKVIFKNTKNTLIMKISVGCGWLTNSSLLFLIQGFWKRKDLMKISSHFSHKTNTFSYDKM